MSDAGKNYSREPQESIIPAGKDQTFQLSADYFVIDRCQADTEAGADVTLYASVNDRKEAPIRRGEPGAAVNLGRGEIGNIKIYNRTASPAFIRIIYGYGSRPYSPETIITNPTLAIDADTITDLADAISPTTAQTPGWYVQAYNLTKTLTGARSCGVTNSGEVAVTVQGKTLGVGQTVEWEASGPRATLGAIVVVTPNDPLAQADIVYTDGAIS